MSRRRSVRKFTAERISESSLNALVDAGLLAPSAKNLRPVELFVVKDKESIEKLAECRDGHSAIALKTAPLAIIVAGHPEKSDLWSVDAAIAATQIMLQAEALHLGCCWIQVMNRTCGAEMSETAVRNALSLPSGISILCMMAIGYADEVKAPYDLTALDRTRVHYL